MKLLLEREDVSPDRPENCGRTPLSLAATSGNEGVVKLLLERENVSPDRPANSGRTPLFFAAGNGHEGVVKLLLEREDVNPNMPDNDGRTPLWRAEQRWGKSVVKLLKARKAAIPITVTAPVVRPYLTPLNLAIYTLYNLSRHFTAVSTLSPAFLRYMKHIHLLFFLLDSPFHFSGVSGTKARNLSLRINSPFYYSRISLFLRFIIIERTWVRV